MSVQKWVDTSRDDNGCDSGSYPQMSFRKRSVSKRPNPSHSTLTLSHMPECRPLSRAGIQQPRRKWQLSPNCSPQGRTHVPRTASIVARYAGSGERRERSRTDTDAALRTPCGVPPALARGTEPLSYTNHIGYHTAIRLFDMVRCGPGLRCPASRQKPDAWKARKSRQVSGFIKIW